MNKNTVLQAIIATLRTEFETFRNSAKTTREAGNDTESKAEGKYDTRSIEDNYLADGLSRQAQATAHSAAAYENLAPRKFNADTPIDLGALVQLEFPDETRWFFLGPAAGGMEVVCKGNAITVLTPESPLGRQLIGLKVGDITASPRTKVLAME